MKARENLDYIIVLGAHVDGTRMTLALLERTRRALLYLEENPGTRAVLSGGMGDGERISEAEAMYRYLTEHGIDGGRLIREERSTNTKENLDYSLELIGSTEPAIGEIYPVPSRYRSWRLLLYIPREILAIIKDKIVGNL